VSATPSLLSPIYDFWGMSIFELFWRPRIVFFKFKDPKNQFQEIDSASLCSLNLTTFKESLAGIFKKSMRARNRGGIGLSYRPARLHRVAEFIPWNRFLGSINV
jgi:hypothetical protein